MKTPALLERMMFGFMESQILFVLHDAGVFDCLYPNPMTARQIGQVLDINSDALDRLLIGAVSFSLLNKVGDLYALEKQLDPFLVKSSPHYIGRRFSHYWKTSYHLAGYLKEAVQDNKPQWGKLETISSNDDDFGFVYERAIYNDPHATAEFLETMWASGYNDSVDLCRQFPLTHSKALVDLGGASGSFALAAAQENPHLKAVILDYPVVEPYANEKIQHHSLEHRVQFQSGNMFGPILPFGDVYVIGYVLSDWPLTICQALLKTVYDHLPPNGILLILEKFFDEDKTGPYLTAMLNTVMLLEMYGSHKTASEYITILKSIGFKACHVVRSIGEKHMIVGRK
jgi:hypothetical protein